MEFVLRVAMIALIGFAFEAQVLGAEDRGAFWRKTKLAQNTSAATTPKLTPKNSKSVPSFDEAKPGETGTTKPVAAEDVKSARPERPEAPNDLKRMVDDYKSAQAKFLDEQKDLRQKMKDATEQERSRIRVEIQSKREVFLEQQRDAREEIRKRLNDLKDRLPTQRDVLEEAKGQSKGPVKGGKGGAE